MYSTVSLHAKEKRKISCSAWNQGVIPLPSPGSAQPVARGQQVARRMTFEMGNLLVTLSLGKPSEDGRNFENLLAVSLRSHTLL
jgi:hypothetical protein